MSFLQKRKKKWLEAGHKELDFWCGPDKKVVLPGAIQKTVLTYLHELTHWGTDKLLKGDHQYFWKLLQKLPQAYIRNILFVTNIILENLYIVQ